MDKPETGRPALVIDKNDCYQHMRIIDSEPDAVANVDCHGFLLVAGIEKWITGLIPMGSVKRKKAKGSLVMFRDSETGAKFVIGRVK